MDPSVLNVQFINSKARAAKDHAALKRALGSDGRANPKPQMARVPTFGGPRRLNCPTVFTWAGGSRLVLRMETSLSQGSRGAGAGVSM